MGWIRRDTQNKVCEWARNAAPHLTEELPDSNPEVQAYLNPSTVVVDKDAECRKAVDADSTADIDLFKLLRSKAISDLAFRLGVNPAALTPTQLQNERNRIAAIYAAL